MEIRVDNKVFDKFNEVEINLEFNTVASGFSFDMYFDPENQTHRDMVRPGFYKEVEIKDEGELILTGTILNADFEKTPNPDTVTVEGYSKPGILEDVNVPVDQYPIEFNKQTLKNIAKKLVGPFEIETVFDSSISQEANKSYEKIEADTTQSIKSFLAELASQRNIVLTHNEKGQLVFTKADTNQTPIGKINGTQPSTKLDLKFSGQDLHTPITVLGEASPNNKNATESTVENPIVKAKRPKVVKQTSGKDTDAEQAAKNVRASELSSIGLNVEFDRWRINGKIIKPGQLIRIVSKDVFLRTPTDFFIESLDLVFNNEEKTASFNVVLPEVYSGDEPKDIFK